ncbi:hypothetical protein ASD38_09160 [Caulobacter sp. Root487D2Y]|uniref:hypothetical protein n=1 Tax=Caulobacter sp. Root487D2Y TaxID=1736547 RepID=UPI0007004EA1|nr:hypothetical protein [Caulobacter sp. Root487D2Y]KQY29497.1 hypothetical protein ASD38_09160 [Caulobacter sp. Root487D2Y]
MSGSGVPSEELAALTVDRLIKSGLLRADKRAALIEKVAAGTMKGEDWKSEIDLASMKAGNS